ncbi:phytoene/squalene synthase family protein [Georgenia sp. Z1491]|uniref:phytoene/squalene synthase family protein n=1 Tax=Georgenia sp. Z1491 TaxID=3416707 RepID=UPI003CEEAA92
MSASAALERYDRASAKVSRLVLREYSTSFGLASALLAREMRPHIANIYGLVRVADEIVDGPAHAAGLDVAARGEVLDRLEDELRSARAVGYSANPVVHSFVATARRFGIGEDLTAAFFASMRADLTTVTYTQEMFDAYVYGSAEVVGLMCLEVFLGDDEVSPARRARLEHGARRLGAAFQKVNFLRDLAEDHDELGRTYFPGTSDGVLGDERKGEITTSIRRDLDVARESLPDLPSGARPAVIAALRLFAELNRRIERVPASVVARRRVRVPAAVKACIVAGAVRTGRRSV